MSIKFKALRKINPSHPSNPMKWYAMAVGCGEIGLDELAAYATETSTVSKADILAVLEVTLSKVSQELSEGKIVRVGDYFTLQMSVSSEASDTEMEVTADKIKGCRIVFKPGKMFCNMMKLSRYEKMA